jgi:hypothetical protein
LEGKRVTGAESEASLTQHRPLILQGFRVVYFNIKNSNHGGENWNKIQEKKFKKFLNV